MKVFIIAAVSADGYIAREANQPANWTSKEDKKVFVELTKRAGVMAMGHTTYQTIGRPLPGRKTIVYSHQDITIEGVDVTHEAPAALIKRLEAEGYTELAVCGGRAIYDLFLQAGVVNELYLTLEPVLFGAGIPLFKTPTNVNLELQSSRNLTSNTLLLQYGVV